MTKAWDDGRPDTVSAFERARQAPISPSPATNRLITRRCSNPGCRLDIYPMLSAASERAFSIIRAAAERLAALTPPGVARPPAMMMALHIWSLAHGIASLFGRGDAARRKLPMSAEDLLEAGVLIYLRGLGFPTERRSPEDPNARPSRREGRGIKSPRPDQPIQLCVSGTGFYPALAAIGQEPLMDRLFDLLANLCRFQCDETLQRRETVAPPKPGISRQSRA